jgi:hypothetical protein
MSIARRKKHRPDFDARESIFVDIMMAQYEILNKKLNKLLFLNGVNTDLDSDIYQERDNEIKVVSGGRGRG